MNGKNKRNRCAKQNICNNTRYAPVGTYEVSNASDCLIYDLVALSVGSRIHFLGNKLPSTLKDVYILYQGKEAETSKSDLVNLPLKQFTCYYRKQ